MGEEETLPKNMNSTIDQTTETRGKTARSPKAMKSITGNSLFGEKYDACPPGKSIGGAKVPNVTSEWRAGQSSGSHRSVAARSRLKQTWKGTPDACARIRSSRDERISQKNSNHNFMKSAALNSCIGPKETDEGNLQSTKGETIRKNKTSTIGQRAERGDKTARSPKATKSVTDNNLFGENSASCPLSNSTGGKKVSNVKSERRAEQASRTNSSVAARSRLKHAPGASHVCAWSKSGGEESISQKNSIN